MWGANPLEMTPMLGKIEGKKKKDMTENNITDSMDMNLSRLQEIVEDREDFRAAIHGVAESDMT